MSTGPVRQRILATLDDIEHTSRELFEYVLLPKNQRSSTLQSTSVERLAELLVVKDVDLRIAMAEASTQEDLYRLAEQLRGDVDKLDDEIGAVQKHLKEAEHILATAIFQAKQKSHLIVKSADNPLNSEDLIKYSHLISSAHSTAAPFNWEHGDPRRPYPTDLQMRQSLLQSLSSVDSTATGIHLASLMGNSDSVSVAAAVSSASLGSCNVMAGGSGRISGTSPVAWQAAVGTSAVMPDYPPPNHMGHVSASAPGANFNGPSNTSGTGSANKIKADIVSEDVGEMSDSSSSSSSSDSP